MFDAKRKTTLCCSYCTNWSRVQSIWRRQIESPAKISALLIRFTRKDKEREENEERQCDCKWLLKKFIDHSGIRLRFWRAPFHFFIFNFEIFLLWENCRFYNDCIKQLRGNKLVCQCYRIQTKSAVVYKYLRRKKKRKGNWHLSIDFSYKTPSLWHLRLDSKEGTQKGFQAKQFVRFKIRCLTDKTQSGKALQSLSIQSPPTVTHKL